MKNCKVGLLPLYLELYYKACPEIRPRINEFHSKVSDSLIAQGIDLINAPICRLKDEFHAAIDIFEKESLHFDGIDNVSGEMPAIDTEGVFMPDTYYYKRGDSKESILDRSNK